MQRLWKEVLSGKGCSEKEAAAIASRFRRGTKSGTLDVVRKELADRGITNGGGRPYSRARIKQFVREGLCSTLALLCDKSKIGGGLYEQRIARAVDVMLRDKVSYSCSTEKDPHLQGRLEWWRLRKVGKKPNGSWYEKKQSRHPRKRSGH